MNTTPQRWERPFDFPPGHWKKQLPTKYLKIAIRGDIGALRQLLTEHPDFLNKCGAHNRTLLWEAVRHGKIDAVKWLTDQGADVGATGCYNGESHVQLTPYCAAIYYKRHEIADFLRPISPPPDIFRAAFLGGAAQVAHFLDADPVLLNAEDPHDNIYFMPPISFAVAGGHAPMVDFLLQRGAVVAPYSAQLIYLAAKDSRLDLVELLLKNGADMQAVDGGIFVPVSDLAIMRFLLDHGVSASRIGKNGFPPLVYLARGDKGEHAEKIQLLLEYGADVNAVGPQGRTALHHAAAAGFAKVVALLLKSGASTGIKDDQGATPLRLARLAGKFEVVKLLIGRST